MQKYNTEYRRVLSRIHREDIKDLYQTLLCSPYDNTRLTLLSLEEENYYRNTHITEDQCKYYYKTVLPFNDKALLSTTLRSHALYYESEYNLFMNTIVPSRYLLNNLDELNLAFDYSFQPDRNDLFWLLSQNENEEIILDWSTEKDKQVIEMIFLVRK